MASRVLTTLRGYIMIIIIGVFVHSTLFEGVHCHISTLFEGCDSRWCHDCRHLLMRYVVLQTLVDHYIDYDTKHVSKTYGHWKLGSWICHPVDVSDVPLDAISISATDYSVVPSANFVSGSAFTSCLVQTSYVL